MPILEFSCRKCQHKFEELVLKKDELNKIKCPKCGGRKLERLYSAFGFVSKGSSKGSVGSGCTSCARNTCAGCSK